MNIFYPFRCVICTVFVALYTLPIYGQSCSAPALVTAENILSTSAEISWTVLNTPAEYIWDIEIIEAGSLPIGVPTYANITGFPFQVTNLEPQTEYVCFVRAQCTTENSPWSNAFRFTTSFTNPTACALDLSIPDNSCNLQHEFVIDVMGAPGLSLGTDVRLSALNLIIEHTWVSDLEIWLTSPSGITVEISTDNGNSGDNLGDPYGCNDYCTFINNACDGMSIKDGTAPFIGEFLPEGNLEDFNDGGSPTGGWTLKICDDAGSDFGSLQYAHLSFEPIICDPVKEIVVSNVTPDAVDIEWLGISNCDNIVIEYGPSGFQPGICTVSGGGNIDNINCNTTQPYTLSGLSELTEYDLYIRNICTTGCSPNSCLVQFKTSCATPAMTVQEHFDFQFPCASSCGASCLLYSSWQNSTEDDFDWLVHFGATPTSNTGPTSDVSGFGNFIYTEASGTQCNNIGTAILESNCMLIDASSDNCHMSFSYHMNGGDIGKISLEISPDFGASWLPIWTDSGEKGEDWLEAFIDLSLYDGTQAQFRLIADGILGSRGDMAIDDIRFYGTIDQGPASNVFYQDQDGDGFGDANLSITSCDINPPIGYTSNALDCNDADVLIHPNAIEIPCNQIDENCSGLQDDFFLEDPIVNSYSICEGQNINIVLPQAQGDYYWFQNLQDSSPFHVGNSYATNDLFGNTEYYIVDSIHFDYGIRITEIDLNSPDAIEIQNIGGAKNFTGYFLAVNGSNANINAVNASFWDLGPMNAGEIDFKNDSASGQNYWGSNIVWGPGPFPAFTGWAMIIDPSGTVVDAVFWGWRNSDIQSLNTTINGFNITANDLPWNGKGVNITSGCGANNSIQLTGFLEEDRNTDYLNCGNANIGIANPTLDWSGSCKSNRVPISVATYTMPDIFINDSPTICLGDSIDLSTLNIIDANDTNSTYEFYDGVPPASGSLTNSTIVSPGSDKTYYLMAISPQGCSDTSSFLLKVNAPPVIDLVPEDVTLCTNEFLQISGTVNGEGPFQYLWDDGTTNAYKEVYASNQSGTSIAHTVTVIDRNGCESIATSNVLATSVSATIIDISDVTLCEGNDGSIDLQFYGNGPFNVNWEGPNTGAVFNVPNNYILNNLEQGAYQVTVTDVSAGTCVLVLPEILLNVGGPSANIALDEISGISCYNSNDASIFISVSGNSPSVIWSTGSTLEDQSGLSPGTYSVTVSDGICVNSIENIVIEEAPELIANSSISHISCFGNQDGSIQIFPQGGTPPYTFSWNNGNIVKDIYNLSPGIYTLNITDSKLCNTSYTYEIIERPLLAIDTDQILQNSCFQESNAQIMISPFGGNPPYSYQWSNGSVNQDQFNLTAGQYGLTLSDASNCTQIANFIIEEVPKLDISFANKQNVSCFGANDGSIQVNTYGGTAPYSFIWNTGATTEDLTNISGGTYSLTISDANNCSKNISFEIEEAESLAINLLEINQISCEGISNASIAVNATGGNGEYHFQWSNSDSSSQINNLSTGQYLLTVSDQNNCSATAGPFEINDLNTLSVEVLNIQHTNCNKSEDGAIALDIIGGAPPYTIAWNNDETSANLTQLNQGEYAATITDANACITETAILAILEPEPILLSFNELKVINCHGDANGKIDIDITGGTAPYTYLWNTGQSSNLLENLDVGAYTLTVTDAQGCTQDWDPIQITQPEPLTIQEDLIANVICYGEATGAVYVIAEGGIPPYTYAWNSGENGPGIENIYADIYAVTVEDAVGCSAVLQNLAIVEPLSAFEAEIVDFENISCFEADDAMIRVEVSGGASPFQYNWSNGTEHDLSSFTDAIFGLEQAEYNVTITDNNGCVTVSETVGVTQPSDLMISDVNISGISCFQNANGVIDVTIEGGQSPYQFQWSNGATSEDLMNISAAQYRVTIIDANGCQEISQNWNVAGPSEPLNAIVDVLQPSTCFGFADGYASIQVTGGTSTYSYNWNNGNTSSFINDIPGIYSCTVTDANSCTTIVENIEITGAAEVLEVELLDVADNLCAGNISGGLNIDVSGGEAPYVYNWSNGSLSEDVGSLGGGYYQCTITDALGCTITAPGQGWFVYEPEPFFVNTEITASYSGLSNGTATILLTGGTSPYFYNWDSQTGGQEAATATNLSAGFYTVTITDQNGCSIVETVEVPLQTNVDEIDLKIKTTLYPNPSSGLTNLSIQLKEAAMADVIVYSNLGKALIEQNIAVNNLSNTSFDLTAFPDGVYYFHVKTPFGSKAMVYILQKEE